MGFLLFPDRKILSSLPRITGALLFLLNGCSLILGSSIQELVYPLLNNKGTLLFLSFLPINKDMGNRRFLVNEWKRILRPYLKNRRALLVLINR